MPSHHGDPSSQNFFRPAPGVLRLDATAGAGRRDRARGRYCRRHARGAMGAAPVSRHAHRLCARQSRVLRCSLTGCARGIARGGAATRRSLPRPRCTAFVGGTRFLGTTLWTDYALYGSTPADLDRAMADAAIEMNDFRMIEWADGEPLSAGARVRELHLTGVTVAGATPGRAFCRPDGRRHPPSAAPAKYSSQVRGNPLQSLFRERPRSPRAGARSALGAWPYS